MGSRAQQRMLWLLQWLSNQVRCPFKYVAAWEVDLTEAFLSTFPEAAKTTRFYTIGAPSIPMLNSAAKRAKLLGFVRPGVIGNQDARSYNQRTWCRTWHLTPAGESAAKPENPG